jgi:hypothetical protein
MKARPTFIAAALLVASVAQAQNSSALINEALDKIVELDLDTTLPQALKNIEDKTGVPIRATRATYDMLPWGEQTKLTAKISQQTLRNSLAAITQKLGLKFTVGDQEVLIEPLPALARLAERAKADELAIVDLLASTPYPNAGRDQTLQEVAAAVDAHFVSLGGDKPRTLENRTDNAASIVVKTFKGQTMLDVLEEIHKQTRNTWYPWGPGVVIRPKEELIRTLLEKPVSARFAGVDVAQVLTELSRRSGVDFTVEPGAVQRIPQESRTIKLTLENVSVRQALESISGFTGLGYVINESGVYIWNPASTVTRRPDRVVTIMTIDGVQVLLPENELPPDVKEYLTTKRQKAIDTLREQMKKDGFQPTTKPANEDL